MIVGVVADAIKDFGPPVAWIIAAVGLYVNNRAANVREQRKEFRSEIDSISGTVKEVIKKLAEYYALEARTPKAKSLELEIKVLLKEIDLKSDRISKRRFRNDVATVRANCQLAQERFFDGATSKYFESDDWQLAEVKSENFHQVNILGLHLIEAGHALFLKEFDNL